MNSENQIQTILAAQRAFFATGQTLNLQWRIAALKKLKTAILNYETELTTALTQDLHKPLLESYSSELVLVINEINYALKNLKKWGRPQKVPASLLTFPSQNYVVKEPYGVVLVIAPWNYPVQLALAPLAGAIAAGNCVILKPSELAPATATVLERLINSTFDSEYITIITGDAAVSQGLLEERFDKIFFTGSPTVGRIVMEKAARYLTPVTLELGGKSPCIVDKNVDLEVAAKRIIWGKFFNAGQTCVAPDYLLVDQAIKKPFYAAMQKYLIKFFGTNPETSPDLARIINLRHFQRLETYLASGKIIWGGRSNPEQLYIEPTIMEITDLESPVMQEEIFGPILPVIDYTNRNEIFNIINRHPNPLALYVFSKDKAFVATILKRIPFGGGCVNDTLSHLTNHHLPFGGRGTSGIGNYHGKYSFEVFSHSKAVLKKGFSCDLPQKYPPYKETHRLIRKFLLK